MQPSLLGGQEEALCKRRERGKQLALRGDDALRGSIKHYRRVHQMIGLLFLMKSARNS